MTPRTKALLEFVGTALSAVLVIFGLTAGETPSVGIERAQLRLTLGKTVTVKGEWTQTPAKLRSYNARSHWPNTSYRYEVDGREYANDVIVYPNKWRKFSADEQETPTIEYLTAKPEISDLELGDRSFAQFIVAIMIMLLVLSVWRGMVFFSHLRS